MLLFDATHTSHTRAQTGIQRVARSLFSELAASHAATAVCYDPYFKSWRLLNRQEQDQMVPGLAAPGSRGAKWPLHQRVTGHARRLLGLGGRLPAGNAFVCPELFSARTGAHLAEIFAAVSGPRVAIFHDAIGLKLPELTPPGTVARLPAYLRELLRFDGVAADSEDSATCLREFWQWLGVGPTPPVQTIPLGLDVLPPAPAATPPPSGLRVLCVGTLEGRKNHLALLEASEMLWREGLSFELQLLGLARADTAGAALAKIAGLQGAGRPLRYQGAVSDAHLRAAYRECSFTVYPSLIEGFGLPVLEGLQHGKPCVCSARGALGESARGGGCVALESVEAVSLAAAMRRLLQNPGELSTLATAARARTIKNWATYACELKAWMQTLPRRA